VSQFLPTFATNLMMFQTYQTLIPVRGPQLVSAVVQALRSAIGRAATQWKARIYVVLLIFDLPLRHFLNIENRIALWRKQTVGQTVTIPKKNTSHIIEYLLMYIAFLVVLPWQNNSTAIAPNLWNGWRHSRTRQQNGESIRNHPLYTASNASTSYPIPGDL